MHAFAKDLVRLAAVGRVFDEIGEVGLHNSRRQTLDGDCRLRRSEDRWHTALRRRPRVRQDPC
jgi:hypothetical protein